VVAHRAGIIEYVTAKEIRIRTTDGELDSPKPQNPVFIKL